MFNFSENQLGKFDEEQRKELVAEFCRKLKQQFWVGNANSSIEKVTESDVKAAVDAGFTDYDHLWWYVLLRYRLQQRDVSTVEGITICQVLNNREWDVPDRIEFVESRILERDGQ